MAGPDIRIDRVIRVTFWNHQTVSVLVEAGRLYIIRTGVVAAAATGSVLNEGSLLIANILLGGGGGVSNPTDKAGEDLRDRAMLAAGGKIENGLTRLAIWDAKKRETRIAQQPLDLLATGWMSANLPLSLISHADVSETATHRVRGPVPQLKITAGTLTITLRFPHTPREVVEGLAAYLLQSTHSSMYSGARPP